MIRLAIDDAGEGTPVVLLHGLTATRRYVVMGSRALERGGHRVVAYDARGHGASDPGPAYDYPSLAGDLRDLLDERGIDRAVLAGASMGAHTAVRLALDEPERVAGIVAVTPAFAPERDPGLEGWDALARGLRSGGIDGFVGAYDFTRVPEGWRETVEKVIRQRLAEHEHLDAVADALEQVPRSEPFADWSELSAIEAPAVVVGSRDDADPGHPLEAAEAWARALHGELVVEDEGRSPLAWQGGQLSKVIAELATQAVAA